MRCQRSLAAANIEDLVTPSNQLGNAPEFGPRTPGSAQDVVKVPTPMKIEVKDFIAGMFVALPWTMGSPYGTKVRTAPTAIHVWARPAWLRPSARFLWSLENRC